ncbi:uncharacterized protein ACO6RY_03297 [Pungitius sinensis]
MTIKLKVNGPTGRETIVTLCDSEEEMKKITAKQLKKIIARELGTDDEFKMVHRSVELEDSSLLWSHGIRHMSTVHTVLMLPGGVRREDGDAPKTPRETRRG